MAGNVVIEDVVMMRGNLTDDGFTNEDLRVGGPHLCALPAEYIPIAKDHPLYSRLYGNDNEVWKYVAPVVTYVHWFG